jgi:prophage regulatory protein
MARLIPPDLLKPLKGITYSRAHLARLERAGRFPKKVLLGPGRVGGYVEEEIDQYVAQKIAERDAAVAALPEIVQRDDGDYQVGLADDAAGPFESRAFAEAVARKGAADAA